MIYFAYQPNAQQQGAGFGTAFAWDVDLLSGYPHQFLVNVAEPPSSDHYGGCDTPEIAQRLAEGGYAALIVTGWYLKCYWQAIRAARKLGIPVLVRGDSQLATPRSKLKALAKEFAYRLMLKSFDGFLTVGQRNREYLQHYGVSCNKIFHAPHFIDNADFAQRAVQAAPERVALRAGWDVGPDQIALLFVGKFIPEKGLPTLLDGIAAVECSHANLYRLILVGSGPLEMQCRAQASALGINVTFAGFKNQSELPAYYSAADVLGITSISETWGLVVNEAMACGTPAIVSQACGCEPDLIESGRTGYSFPLGDVSALTECLRQFAAAYQAGHDWRPALAAKLSHYSVTTCTQGTLRALHFLVS